MDPSNLKLGLITQEIDTRAVEFEQQPQSIRLHSPSGQNSRSGNIKLLLGPAHTLCRNLGQLAKRDHIVVFCLCQEGSSEPRFKFIRFGLLKCSSCPLRFIELRQTCEQIVTRLDACINLRRAKPARSYVEERT